ncbi:SH3 domain-containing protein [Escovopsis weberi]|uniref:SH3 domain-containing protein n=1 Tax=Escovopsis weberi TaxID=150374 RepID=A0A0M9VSL3_ESCWE|nr:SH3 domain-containing protein [Escovopsis weberi]
MQRVSAFLPTWERRNSTANKTNAATPNSPSTPRTSPSAPPSPSTAPPTTTVTSEDDDAGASATATSAISAITTQHFSAAHKNSISSISSSTNGLFRWSHRSTASTKIDTFGCGLDCSRAQREKFWPATLDLECDKAARILKSFCVDGFLAPIDHDDLVPPSSPTSDAPPPTPARVRGRIPKRIIQNAAGIAVFSCMRSGLWMTGCGGSGILIARKSDGTWSPPSGIMLHIPTMSFVIGVDIYDCVLVVSSYGALEAVTMGRVNLGNEVELRSGQTVPLDSDETEVIWRGLGDSLQTYTQARGQQQNVDMTGCILTERSNENERFYYADVTQMEILSGSVAREVEETTPLFEIIKMAEGRTDFDQSVVDKISAEPTPSDTDIIPPPAAATAAVAVAPASPQKPFGIVKQDDPDPFGVLALEMAGLEIREAGSRMRPTSSMIDIKLTPLDPIFSKFGGRQSLTTLPSRSDRGSIISARTMRSQLTDAGTQTDGGIMPEIVTSLDSGDEASLRICPAEATESVQRQEQEVEEQEEEEEEEEEEQQQQQQQQQLDGQEIDLAIDEKTTAQDRQGEEVKTPEAEQVDIHVGASDAIDEMDCGPAPVCPPLNPARLSARSIKVIPVKKEEEEEEGEEEEEVEIVQAVAVNCRQSRVLVAKSEVDDEDDTNDADDEDDVNEEEREGDRDGEEADEDYEEDDEDGDEDDEEEEEEEEEEVVVFEVAAVQPARTQAVASRMIQARGNVVTIAKRVPPPLPKRSPARMSRVSKPEFGDRSSLRLSTNEAEWGLRRGSTDSTAQGSDSGDQSVVKVEIMESTPGGAEDRRSRGESPAELELDHEEASNGEANTGDESLLSEPHLEGAENSDSASASNKKHTSSIYTGITEDRWSCDGSSVTTPVSERRFSMNEDRAGEDITPTISKRLSTGVEKPAVRGSLSSLHEVMKHNSVVATE